MLTVLYIVFFVSLLAPIYTYAVYPIILKVLPEKRNKSDDMYRPFVSILVVSEENNGITDEKDDSLGSLCYPTDKLELLTSSDEFDTVVRYIILKGQDRTRAEKLNAMLKVAKGDILIITDGETPLDKNVVINLVKHFSDQQVGCVIGQLRSKSPSSFWKYENYVRSQESKIGCVSGANKGLYAVRSGVVNDIPASIIKRLG